MGKFIVKTVVMHTSGDLIATLSEPINETAADNMVERVWKIFLDSVARNKFFTMRDTEAHGCIVFIPVEKVDYFSVDKIEVNDGED
jgi:hypothetical protein